jgi:hypothetical protein
LGYFDPILGFVYRKVFGFLGIGPKPGKPPFLAILEMGLKFVLHLVAYNAVLIPKLIIP